jgi:hypothetical protein
MKNMKPFLFHGLQANTGNYLQGSNNFPYGAPKPSLADDELPYGDEPAKRCPEEDGVKCFSCKGWFPASSCVVNHGDYGEVIPVCETCADGRFWPKPDGNNTDPWEYGEQP